MALWALVTNTAEGLTARLAVDNPATHVEVSKALLGMSSDRGHLQSPGGMASRSSAISQQGTTEARLPTGQARNWPSGEMEMTTVTEEALAQLAGLH